MEWAGVAEDCRLMPGPPDARQAYGVGKGTAEHLCALAQQRTGLQVVVAGCFALVGPDLPLDIHFAIGNFIRDALHDSAVVVRGDGRPVRSYMHQADLAEWLLDLLDRGEPGKAYNVGSDEGITLGELAHFVRDLLAPSKPVRVLSVPQPESERSLYLQDISKASALGLTLRWGLKDAILDTAQAVTCGGTSSMLAHIREA